MTKSRLWRVDSNHIRGYNAPQMFIETESERLHNAEAEALTLAKENSRLANLPGWTMTVTLLFKHKLNGKWYSKEEYNYKTKDLYTWEE